MEYEMAGKILIAAGMVLASVLWALLWGKIENRKMVSQSFTMFGLFSPLVVFVGWAAVVYLRGPK